MSGMVVQEKWNASVYYELKLIKHIRYINFIYKDKYAIL